MSKFCPFMSSKDKPVDCCKDCQLYRSNREGYECTFQEIIGISWNTRGVKNSNNNGNNSNLPVF